ncbi:MAG: hypothetical protein KKB50_06735 [Planctomycetes bacterium]|nr:hypothetical protein [Planctomycetota bacterium]
MKCSSWDSARLREHEGERLPLGDGSVVLRYQLFGNKRVYVTFFLRDGGRIERCASEFGSMATLIELLEAYTRPGPLAMGQRAAKAGTNEYQSDQQGEPALERVGCTTSGGRFSLLREAPGAAGPHPAVSSNRRAPARLAEQRTNGWPRGERLPVRRLAE